MFNMFEMNMFFFLLLIIQIHQHTHTCIYRIERFKENVIFANDEKHQVGYNERIRYHFDQLLSFENLDQKITVVNSELSVILKKKLNLKSILFVCFLLIYQFSFENIFRH